MLLSVRGSTEKTDISSWPPEFLIVGGREECLIRMVDVTKETTGRFNLDLTHLLKALDEVAIIIPQSDADARKQNSTRTWEDIFRRRERTDTAALSLT
jgi:hypothetical protein